MAPLSEAGPRWLRSRTRPAVATRPATRSEPTVNPFAPPLTNAIQRSRTGEAAQVAGFLAAGVTGFLVGGYVGVRDLLWLVGDNSFSFVGLGDGPAGIAPHVIAVAALGGLGWVALTSGKSADSEAAEGSGAQAL